MTVQTIYMPLLNENVVVWAPVQAENLGDSRFRILGPMPEDEEWEFAVGSVVKARLTRFSGGEEGIAAFEISS
jgi:hypothetical protein